MKARAVIEEISATEFKKHYSDLVDKVLKKKCSFVLTKKRIPIAKIAPLDKNYKSSSYFGFMKGTVIINDDIVNASFEDEWDINHE
jgi:antitoxin (DNA-binding transcriptional repressor) of toxin-antitoxin stability system